MSIDLIAADFVNTDFVNTDFVNTDFVNTDFVNNSLRVHKSDDLQREKRGLAMDHPQGHQEQTHQEQTHQISVSSLTVDVVRKAIKNLHLGVYPPNGRVRVAAPLAVSDEAVRLAVIGKLGWIKRQQAKFKSQPRQSKRQMVTGESHYFLGRRYRLRLVEHIGAPKVVLNKSRLELHIRPEASQEERERLLQHWYRTRLKELVPPLLDKWQPVLEVEAASWGIRRMKTRWGTCNTSTRRILLNLELAKKPTQCVEYILVHELVHLRERQHNSSFRAMLDRSLPNWEQYRSQLNALPVKHEEWECNPDGTTK